MKYCYYCQTDSHNDSECWSTRPDPWRMPIERYTKRIAALEIRLEAAEELLSKIQMDYNGDLYVLAMPKTHWISARDAAMKEPGHE